MPWAEGLLVFMAWSDKGETLALVSNLKTGRELKCYVEYLHPLAKFVPKNKGQEGKENK